MSDLFYGTVIFFNPEKGFGFIKWDKDNEPQKDIFVHWTDIETKPNVFKTLYKNQKVCFKIGTNVRGEPKAINVNVLNH